jgi:toxin ParE1/3/4
VRLVVAKEAVADIDRLRHFLAEKDSEAARRAVAVIYESIQSLEVFPGRGRPSGIPGLRELTAPFGRSAYLIRYAYLPQREVVVIVRVWHGREARR